MISAADRHGIIAGGTWCADHNKLVDRWPGEEDQKWMRENNLKHYMMQPYPEITSAEGRAGMFRPCDD
ncbi:MAG: hypothetical protein VW870_04110 [Rhodobiaceae bacterium]